MIFDRIKFYVFVGTSLCLITRLDFGLCLFLSNNLNLVCMNCVCFGQFRFTLHFVIWSFGHDFSVFFIIGSGSGIGDSPSGRGRGRGRKNPRWGAPNKTRRGTGAGTGIYFHFGDGDGDHKTRPEPAPLPFLGTIM